MKRNYPFFQKKISFIYNLLLLILVFGVFISPSWAAFDSTFPDNTVFTAHSFESGFQGDISNGPWSTEQMYIVKDQFTFMADGTFTTNLITDDELTRSIGDDQQGGNTFSVSYASETGTESGTYSISPDGTVTMTFTGEEDSATGVLSEDGQTFIISFSEYSENDGYGVFGIGMGVKRGSGFESTLPDNTIYETRVFESGFQGGGGGQWSAEQMYLVTDRITFMADGTFTTNLITDDELTRSIGVDQEGGNTFSVTYSSETGTESGTYSISSDGTVTLTFTGEGDSATGVVSEDGQTFIFSFSEYSENDGYGVFGIGVGVKRGTGFESSFPDNTVYASGEFESGFLGGSDGQWSAEQQYLVNDVFTFMADGTFTTNLITDEELTRSMGSDGNGGNTFSVTHSSVTGTESGTYSIASDGTVTLTFNDEGEEDVATGILSEDGQTFIFSFSEYDNTDSYGVFGIGMGVKSLIEAASSSGSNSLLSILPLILEEE